MGSWWFGWIEIIFFYGIAIGFGLWQVWKTDKELKKTRAERLEREAKEAAKKAQETGGSSPSPEASDRAT
ncbi:MAG: hypothetical protein QNI87_08605 [Erythrobacter sp.]|uniref:hypothetical protein n=1 Tax=Erythrobacter sp. TaxID=1042 RepID=UPI002601A22D|nr:hypothetical protein [Erythrobacter sp.]MDJ0978584.1 hypothetical protein [Erythrobacter sp.]